MLLACHHRDERHRHAHGRQLHDLPRPSAARARRHTPRHTSSGDAQAEPDHADNKRSGEVDPGAEGPATTSRLWRTGRRSLARPGARTGPVRGRRPRAGPVKRKHASGCRARRGVVGGPRRSAATIRRSSAQRLVRPRDGLLGRDAGLLQIEEAGTSRHQPYGVFIQAVITHGGHRCSRHRPVCHHATRSAPLDGQDRRGDSLCTDDGHRRPRDMREEHDERVTRGPNTPSQGRPLPARTGRRPWTARRAPR